MFIRLLLSITLQGSVKFRGLEKDNKIREEILQTDKQAPSHVTIRNWALKMGHYELTREKGKADDWIILLDHSIQFGCEKIFVVLGIREIDFVKLDRPLQYTDLTTLLIVNKNSWNKESVAQELKNLEATIGTIKYAVGDYGSDLRSGLALLSIPHIHDLSHLMALIIEKIYMDDTRFMELKAKMSTVRSKFAQTDIAALMPPKSRKKSEYQSFDKIIRWGNAVLNLITNKLNDPEQIKYLEGYFQTGSLARIKREFDWIAAYSGLIVELSEISCAIKEVDKELKHHGLSTSNLEKCEVLLGKLESRNGKTFKETLLLKINQQIQLLPNTETILFSSDILESLFGKYKNRVCDNPMASITRLMLIIAAFTCDLSDQNVKQSMEKIKIADIKKWSDENIPITLFKKRKVLLAA